jgi:hypothetical protein
LNEGFESEQTTRPVDLKDDGVDIDLPSREEIEWALKYLKKNKTAGADSIAAELFKNGGPNLGLHEVIQQAWTSETLPRRWPEEYCVQCKPDCKNPLTRPFGITRLGSNQINQQQINFLHCSKS